MKYRVLIFGLLFSIGVIANNKDFIFEQISPDAGFAFDAIVSISEDEFGMTWFGCNNGLYCYNTQEIKRYNFDPKDDSTPPSNVINRLYLDHNKLLWICTDNGICIFDKTNDSFKRIQLQNINNYQNFNSVSYMVQFAEREYLAVINNSLCSFNIDDCILKGIQLGGNNNSSVTYLGETSEGEIFAGTAEGSVFKAAKSSSEFNLFYQSEKTRVKTICQDNSFIWIGYYDDGVDKISSDGKLVSSYRQEFSGEQKLPSNRVRKIIQRDNGEIWIGTYDGILLVNSQKNEIINQTPYNRLPHNSIYDLYKDHNGSIWIGTWSGGLGYYSEYNYHFEHVQKLGDLQTGARGVISCFSEVESGSIWFGSEKFGLYNFDLKNKSVTQLPSPDGSEILRIKSLATDKNQRLWIGTFFQGLWYLDKGSRKLERAKASMQGFNQLMTFITPDQNKLWIATRGPGLMYYNTEDGSFKTYQHHELNVGSISSNNIWKTYLDSKENLWVCTDFGLSVKKKGTEVFERFFYNENSNSLSRNKTYTICEDKDGKLWIGTNGGGISIYDPEEKTFNKLNTNSILDNLDIYGIVKDKNNNMWISTNMGIHVYYVNSQTLKSYSEKDGLQGNQFNPNSAFINSEGKIFFGGSNGFNIINPENIVENPVKPNVYVSKFLINNLPLQQQSIRYANALHLPAIEEVELKHNQNSLTFNFITNNPIKPGKNKFRYRLKNYQDEWNDTYYDKDVSFTKIPPGKYILEYFGSNNDGVFNPVAKQITIRIYPPFWLSWYAYLVYSIILGAILIAIVRELIFREKVRKEILAERYKREADEILFAEKTKFFTNVSHEFRTPLTLIISPLNNLMKKFNQDAHTTEQFKSIKRNADRLLRLTNQMLDFRLLELGKIKIKPEKSDIVALCREIVECFEYLIVEKEINLILNSTFKSFYLEYTPDMIEKVIYNLISNALKFSEDKGQIILSIEQKSLNENSYANCYCAGSKFIGDSLEVKIRDFGKGMNPEIMPRIFDRFYMNPENEETGTGIGLHICQEYIKLHSGNIMVSSEPGHGTTFVINLPVNKTSEFDEESIIVQAHFDKLPEITGSNQSEFNPVFRNKLILIAEDNDELRIYLKNFLTEGFKILTAKNGNQAYEIALEVTPDLIISDILMPGMDGLQLTEKIRNNQKTNHIPVILLTALSGENIQKDSVHRGADLFLTKPIDESLLLAQIENILANRDNLIEKYSANINVSDGNGKKYSFIEQAEKYILENIRNEQLDISMLANELNTSRSSLHRKIKNLANQSTTEFIRDVRLKYAIRLMNENKYNMDEIAVLSGFNSTSWFNRSFKQKYGKTPKEYNNGLKKI